MAEDPGGRPQNLITEGDLLFFLSVNPLEAQGMNGLPEDDQRGHGARPNRVMNLGERREGNLVFNLLRQPLVSGKPRGPRTAALLEQMKGGEEDEQMNDPLWRTCRWCEVERGHGGLPRSYATMSLGHIPLLGLVG